MIRNEKFTLARKSFWSESCNFIKLTDVFRVSGRKVSADIRPAGMSLRPKPYLRALIKFSTWHSRGRNHSVYIFLSHVCAQTSPNKVRNFFQIKCDRSHVCKLSLDANQGKFIRHNLSLSRSLLCYAYFL